MRAGEGAGLAKEGAQCLAAGKVQPTQGAGEPSSSCRGRTPSPPPPAKFTPPRRNEPLGLQSNAEPRPKPPGRAQAGGACPSPGAPGRGSGHEVSLPVLPATLRPHGSRSPGRQHPEPQPGASPLHLHHRAFVPRDIVDSPGATIRPESRSEVAPWAPSSAPSGDAFGLDQIQPPKTLPGGRGEMEPAPGLAWVRAEKAEPTGREQG